MVQKPKIQYVGQFYVHGSEALKLEQENQVKTSLPRALLQKIEKVYVDPVAIFGMVAAMVLLVTMILGVQQLKTDWAEYQKMDRYVSFLKAENEDLVQDYRAGYDLEDIQAKAAALGLVPKAELQTSTVLVTMPEKLPEPGKLEQMKLFLEGLFA